jgi:hypothetical protein
MNNELEGMWQDAVVAYCKVLYQHSVVGTEGKHENPQSLIINFWDYIRNCGLPNTGSLFYITTIVFHFLAACLLY